jgi:pimeloyl-ACP methyl ester carboxylesterase
VTIDVAALPAHEVVVDGCAISYRLVGQGRPLLLVMGLGADVSAWQDHVSVYSERFRCILVDNRGIGRSGKPTGPYSTMQMADDCARVVDAVASTPVAVVGISMGGAIAQELALRHPSVALSWSRPGLVAMGTCQRSLTTYAWRTRCSALHSSRSCSS